MASSRMAPPLRARVMGDVVGGGDEAVLHLPETPDSHRPRGWQPKGGDALAVPSFVVDYSVERASAQLT